MNSIYKLIIELIGKDKGVSRELKQTKGEMDALSGAAGKMGGALQAVGAIGLAYMGKQAFDAAWELGELGGRLKDTEDNLIAFAGSAQEAAKFTKAVENASSRTLDEMQAMGTASRLLQMGLASSVEEMDLYVRGAVRLGDQTQSNGQRVSEMVQLLKNLNINMLDNFGLSRQVVMARTQELQATQGLSREQGMLIAIQEELARQLDIVGDAAEDGALAFDQAEVALQNLKLRAAEKIAPIEIKVLMAVDEAITIWEKYWAVVKANAASAAASLQEGVDAQAVYDYYMLKSVMSEKEAATQASILYQERLREAAATREAAAGLGVYLPLLERGVETSEDAAMELVGYGNAAGEAAGASAELGAAAGNSVGAIIRLNDALHGGRGAAQEYAESLLGISDAMGEIRQNAASVSGEEVVSGYESAMGRIESHLAGLAGDASLTALQEVRRRYMAEIEALYRGVAAAHRQGADMTDFELEYRLNMIMNRFDEEVDLLEGASTELGRAAGGVSDAYSELRSAIEAALTPTSVTALDMGLAEAGQYVEKWDENARRLDAIAARGFAELAAHPDWVNILGIPDNVLELGEDALKEWARQTGAAVRDLTRPDLLNVDAAVAAVEQYFADMAARELSIDMITQAVIEKGIVSGDDAKAQVAAALGLDQAIVGEKAGTQIFQGMIDKFTEKSAAGEFATYLIEDTANQAGSLKSAGYELWITTEVGILDAMEEGNYVGRWIELLLPALITALAAQGQWTGEGEP